MSAKITTLNRTKAELAQSEKQLALMQQASRLAGENYQLRSWWLVINLVTLLIGFIIIAGGFYLTRITFSDYLAIALNTIFGIGVIVLNTNRITTFIRLRRQQAASAEQIEVLQARIRVLGESIARHSN